MALIEGFRVHGWAEAMGPRMALDRNVSPSFCKFRDGLKSLADWPPSMTANGQNSADATLEQSPTRTP